MVFDMSYWLSGREKLEVFSPVLLHSPLLCYLCRYACLYIYVYVCTYLDVYIEGRHRLEADLIKICFS